MSKRLVVCCDGTWNTPDQQCPTNVTKLALAVAAQDRDGKEQRTFYHRGVGTNRWERIGGGAFGIGLSRDVREVYRFLVLNYDPGDELFFFGFSRGAFTARSAAGFVRNAGILRREHADRVDEAYALYRDKGDAKKPRGVEATLFRRSYSHQTRIRFIGVWDTVGALGVPLDGLRLVNVFNRRFQFHDTELSSTVDAAFQALAIDERRGPFKPTIWKKQADAPDAQQVEQVWFAGVHSDIGGGYPDNGLSDLSLTWMFDRARSCGLALKPEIPVAPDPLGKLNDSLTGIYRFIPRYDRRLGVTDRTVEYAASSAVDRHKQEQSYAPAGLVTYLDDAPQIMPA
jgi:uncharacterized protein (DUF2235 family)